MKNNMVYKVMAHTNAFGLIRGHQFSAFVLQHSSLVPGLLILQSLFPSPSLRYPLLFPLNAT